MKWSSPFLAVLIFQFIYQMDNLCAQDQFDWASTRENLSGQTENKSSGQKTLDWPSMEVAKTTIPTGLEMNTIVQECDQLVFQTTDPTAKITTAIPETAVTSDRRSNPLKSKSPPATETQIRANGAVPNRYTETSNNFISEAKYPSICSKLSINGQHSGLYSSTPVKLAASVLPEECRLSSSKLHTDTLINNNERESINNNERESFRKDFSNANLFKGYYLASFNRLLVQSESQQPAPEEAKEKNVIDYVGPMKDTTAIMSRVYVNSPDISTNVQPIDFRMIDDFCCDSIYLGFSWVTPTFYHRPLYFEQVNLERYGIGPNPFLQPIYSATHFFGTVGLLPWKLIKACPDDCVYTLGHNRPGACSPYQRLAKNQH